MAGTAPQIENPAQLMLRIQQMKLIQQQAELARQQAEAQRLQNEAQRRALQPQPAPPPKQSSLSIMTAGHINGAGWKSLDPMAKMAFLVGFREAAGELPPHPLKIEFFPSRLGAQETVDLIDRFYLDQANVVIPLVVALPIVTLKATGVAQSDVDSVTSAARAAAAR